MIKYIILLSFLLVGCNNYKSDQCYTNKDFTIYSRITDIDSDSYGDWVRYEYADTRDTSWESLGRRSRLISGSLDAEDNFDGLYSQKVDCKEFQMVKQLLLVKKDLNNFQSNLFSLGSQIKDLQDKVNKKKK